MCNKTLLLIAVLLALLTPAISFSRAQPESNVRSSSDVTALLLDAYHLDSAFGNAGKVITTIQNREQATDVAVQPDGKIVVVGSLYSPSLTSNFFLARYLANGTPDKSFGANGLVITNIDQKAEARALLLQTDGKIIAAGWAWTSDPYHLYCVLARYTAAGQLDPTFGTGGIVRTTYCMTHKSSNYHNSTQAASQERRKPGNRF
jgi:uncharacterized delta-60 repeat protein